MACTIEGFDAAIGGREGAFTWRLAYSFVDATYQSSFEVNAESNSTADANGNILVTPGDRIPLVPRTTARLVLDYDVTKSLNVGANVIYWPELSALATPAPAMTTNVANANVSLRMLISP